jgi:hypothetical protein
MKIRVYRIGEEVIVNIPAPKFQDKIDECPHEGIVQELDPSAWTMEVITEEQLQALHQDQNEDGSNQYYYDGDTLKHDTDWEENLMSPGLICVKHKALLLAEIDEELGKNNPDAVELVRKDREFKKLHHAKTPLAEIYGLALKKLKAENKKPKIQAKLQAKIDELEAN